MKLRFFLVLKYGYQIVFKRKAKMVLLSKTCEKCCLIRVSHQHQRQQQQQQQQQQQRML